MLRRMCLVLFVLFVTICFAWEQSYAHEEPNKEPVPAVTARNMSAEDSLCVEGVDSTFDNYNQHSVQIVVLNFIGNEAVLAADAAIRAGQLASEANAYFDAGMDIHGYGGKLVFSTLPGDCRYPKIYSLDVPYDMVAVPFTEETDMSFIDTLLKGNDLWKQNRRYMVVLNLKIDSTVYCGLAGLFSDGRKVWNENALNTMTHYFQVAPWQGTNCNEGRVVVHEFGHNVMDALKTGMFRTGPNFEFSKPNAYNPWSHFNSSTKKYDPHAAEATDVMQPGGWNIPQYAFMTTYATPYKEYFNWDKYYPRLIDPARGSYCNPNRPTGSFLAKFYNSCDIEGNGSPYLRIWQEKMPDGKPVVVCNETLGSPESRFHALKLCLHRTTGVWWIEASFRNESPMDEVETQLTTGQRCWMPLVENEMDGGFRNFPYYTINGAYSGGICFSKIPLSGAPSLLKGEFKTYSLPEECAKGTCTIAAEMDITSLMTNTAPVLPVDQMILNVSAAPEGIEGGWAYITTTLNSAYHFPVHMVFTFGNFTIAHSIPYGTDQKVFQFLIGDDDVAGVDRTVSYRISSISGVSNTQDKEGTVLVRDNDARVLSLSSPVTRVIEGGVVPLLVSISKPAAHHISGMIGYDGPGLFTNQQFMLPAGQTAITVSQAITDNGVDDPDGRFIARLTDIVSATEDMVITPIAEISLPVVDALDSRPELSIQAPYSLTEGSGETITLTLSAPGPYPVFGTITTSGSAIIVGEFIINTGETSTHIALSTESKPGWQGDKEIIISFEDIHNAEVIEGEVRVIVGDSEPRPDFMYLPVVRR